MYKMFYAHTMFFMRYTVSMDFEKLLSYWLNHLIILLFSDSKINEVAIVHLPFLVVLSLSTEFSLPELTLTCWRPADCLTKHLKNQVPLQAVLGHLTAHQGRSRDFICLLASFKWFWLSCLRLVTSTCTYTRNTHVSRQACSHKNCSYQQVSAQRRVTLHDRHYTLGAGGDLAANLLFPWLYGVSVFPFSSWYFTAQTRRGEGEDGEEKRKKRKKKSSCG